MRVVVSDTGPLLHLHEAGVIGLLAHAGSIHIPARVDAELAGLDRDWQQERPTWVRVAALRAPAQAETTRWQQAGLLDPGEAAAVALARQLHADWLLTDDLAARLFAQAMGTEVHGSLGVVLWAAARGHLDRQDAERALGRLAKSSLWVSEKVLRKARAALVELFGP